MLVLDHIAVVGMTRQLATGFAEKSLGIAPVAQGAHPHFGTHNHLWGMGADCYLESIAIDPRCASTNLRAVVWAGSIFRPAAYRQLDFGNHRYEGNLKTARSRVWNSSSLGAWENTLGRSLSRAQVSCPLADMARPLFSGNPLRIRAKTCRTAAADC